ncbi:CheF family chemotaxis protein [Halegenticoccus tardaugens]|uniref:CheF family chemotaxis protein n=1 Tax=Halegenticoccus tardaugens TaxID=2071624 RepID=UPI00100B1F05|nr:CheF family chemotaxis protein [Halegenticoccus tardaugens]
MSESIVADFVGRFHADALDRERPVRGRILLSRKRLVLAARRTKTTIPLSAVFDVSVGFVPPDLTDFFNDTVTIAYERRGEKRAAVVEGDGGNVDRFATVLFKALLNGASATVVHPARVGGRVTDASAESARLSLRDRAVAFAGCSTPFAVDLGAVSKVEPRVRNVEGARRRMLELTHLDGGAALTSIVGFDAHRRTNLFGRYVRIEYGRLVEEVEALSHTEAELEVLVALYSTGGDARLGTVLDADPSRITMVLNSLRDAGLVVDADGKTTLTPRGRIAVGAHLERVNA